MLENDEQVYDFDDTPQLINTIKGNRNNKQKLKHRFLKRRY